MEFFDRRCCYKYKVGSLVKVVFRASTTTRKKRSLEAKAKVGYDDDDDDDDAIFCVMYDSNTLRVISMRNQRKCHDY